jgi:AmiR/NasT family two-component response regulator
MQSRAVIEQAKGIIMGERRCTADEAFRLIRKVSQDSNRKLRDVAAALVEQAGRSPRSPG